MTFRLSSKPIVIPLVMKSVLVAKLQYHKGAMHGWVANGLPMLDLGNGYGLQIIADETQFRTIQLFKYGLDEKPIQQTYIRTKTKVIKEIKKQKELPKQIVLGETETEVLL